MKTLFALLAFAGAASAGYITNAQIAGFVRRKTRVKANELLTADIGVGNR
jgi:hypothetical protein